MFHSLLSIILLLILSNNVNSYMSSTLISLSKSRSSSLSMALKFDPSKFIKVSITKPLGISLEEVEENANRGVMVTEVKKDGNSRGKVDVGYFLVSIDGKDVKFETFDNILDMIGDAGNEVRLDFIKPDDVFKGPAIVTVITPDGKTTKINTIKGQNLRSELLSANIDVYSSKAKLTNCGGGRSCGTCAVRVIDNKDWDKTPELDQLRLKRFNDPTARLSCNTIIEGDCTVYTLPQKS